MEQVPGQGELPITPLDFERPFGRFAGRPEARLIELGEALPSFLEAAGSLVGSYTLDDRTVFVFESLTIEVFRGHGVLTVSATALEGLTDGLSCERGRRRSPEG